MTSGMKTTEFWLSLAAQIFPLLVLTGVIEPGDRATLEGAVANSITAVAALAASSSVIITYIRGRVQAKRDAAMRMIR